MWFESCCGILKLPFWQTALKLLAGDEEELLQIIPVLMGCTREDIVEENSIKSAIVRDVLGLMKETAFSHLMEVNNLLVRFASTILLQAQNFTKQRTSRFSVNFD